MCRALVVLCIVPFATVAHADAIDPTAPARVCPPMACPPGSHPVGGGHSGCPSECGAPTACDDEHPCAAGSTCTPEPESLCIESVSFGNYEAPVRRGACVEEACPDPQRCWTGRYCLTDPTAAAPVPPPTPPTSSPATAPASPPPPSPSGLCHASPRGASSSIGWVAALVLLAAGRRR